MKKTNNKYNLSAMEIGAVKYFPLELYDKIRMACHFTGKRWGTEYSTEKQKSRIKVTRTK